MFFTSKYVNRSTNHTEIKSLIQKSLMELPQEYVILFHSLVIFPESVSIPVKVSDIDQCILYIRHYLYNTHSNAVLLN